MLQSITHREEVYAEYDLVTLRYTGLLSSAPEKRVGRGWSPLKTTVNGFNQTLRAERAALNKHTREAIR